MLVALENKCEDLLFIKVCSEPTQMHCSTDMGKMHSSTFRSALQNRLTAGWCLTDSADEFSALEALEC